MLLLIIYINVIIYTNVFNLHYIFFLNSKHACMHDVPLLKKHTLHLVLAISSMQASSIVCVRACVNVGHGSASLITL